MDNQYFTPDIEDIRVGYECEVATEHTLGYGWNWAAHKITDFNQLKDVKVRVPYLTKEQIEAEGWTKQTLEGQSPRYFKGLNYLRLITYEDGKTRVVIKHDPHLHEDTGCPLTVFLGDCKDLNTFRYICKLLNIK
jgi:hypothetical protein